MPLDYYASSEVDDSINRIDAILGSGIFKANQSANPLVQSAFIEMSICLRDLMWKSEKCASARISFKDDVIQTSDVKDVTDLIRFVRDAVCHLDSDHHFLTGNVKATFNVLYGKATLIKSGANSQESQYQDDVCFCFGAQRIYLRRHVLRAYEAAKIALLPLRHR